MNHSSIKHHLRRAGAMLATAFCALLLPVAHAEYPDRPIKLVVGYGPGTGSDLQGRAMADQLSKELGTPVFVDNRPGSSGMVAGAVVANAPADGYTLLFGTTAMLVTGPLIQKNAQYDPEKSFEAIGAMAKAPFVVLVPNKPDAPATLQQLLERIRGSNVSFGTTGVGTFGHLAALQMLRHYKLDAVHVPYKSSGQVFQDVVGGNLLFTVDSATAALPLVKGGVLRPLAVTSKERLPSMPQVPTISEVMGSPYEAVVWTGLLVPHGTPAAIVDRLSAANTAALRAPELKARFDSMELQPMNLDAKGFANLIHAEVPAWKDFLQKNNIKAEE